MLTTEFFPVKINSSKNKNINIKYCLSEAQNVSLETIKNQFKLYSVVLFNGVTSSGKTLIYCKLIEEQIKNGNQVLYLLPEIALTSQIIMRIENFFEGYVLVYHSGIPDRDKKEVWTRVLNGDSCVVLGARSAIFLPFINLKLTIIDEEHDSSFRQQSPQPRYNAKDVSVYFATLNFAKVILGSATPSIESLHNAQTKKIGYVELNQKYNNLIPSELSIIDMKKSVFKKDESTILSNSLATKIREELSKKNQIIIFQNKRGYAPYFMCRDCGFIPYCKNCDVSLTFHKSKDILKCHYCSSNYNVIKECKICKSKLIFEKRFGTEQIEELINKEFSKHKILRLDSDTAKSKNNLTSILNKFTNREADFLIGTQMIIKGLDFENVSLVAIVDGDSLFNFIDYRATEKAFQTILQVSGRAGRKNNEGKIYLQMYNTNLPIIDKIKKQDYLGFCYEEIKQRKELNYPPFTKMLEISFKHRDENIVNKVADYYFSKIDKNFKAYFWAPSEPVVNRIKGKHIVNIIGKLPKNTILLKNIKQSLKKLEQSVTVNKEWRSIKIEYWVDF